MCQLDLEWRDGSSGEVIAVWESDGGFPSNAVMFSHESMEAVARDRHRGVR